VVGALITLVALRLTTRYFGPARWGEIVAASALATLFTGLCDFGVTRIVSRELAANDSDVGSVYGAGLIGGILTSLAAMVVMSGAALLVYGGHPSLRSLSFILVLSLPPNAVWVVSGGVLIAKARNDMRGVIDVSSSMLLLAAAGITVAVAFAAAGYLWLTVLADALTAVLGLGLARRYVRADFRGGRRLVRQVLRSAAPVGLSQALSSVYIQADVILLSLFATTAVVGRFGLAYQVAVFITSVPPMLTAAILPKFIDAPAEAQRRLIQRAFEVLVFAGSAIVLYGTIFARDVILLIAGHHYLGATNPFIVLMCASALSFPVAVFADGLVYVKAERHLLRAVTVVTICNLVAAATVIPFFGADGAAAVLLGSVLVLLTMVAVLFRRASGLRITWWSSLRYLAVAVVLLAGYLAVHMTTGFKVSEGWPLAPEAVALGVAYVGLSAAVGGAALLGRERG